MLRLLVVASLLPGCSLFLGENDAQPTTDAAPESDAEPGSDGPVVDRNNNFNSPYECDGETLALYHFNLPDQMATDCGSALVETSVANPTDGPSNDFLEAVEFEDEVMDELTGTDVTAGLDSLTIEAWVRPTAQSQAIDEHRYIVSIRAQDSATDQRIGLALHAAVEGDNNFAIRAIVGDCGSPTELDAGALGVGTWNHVALTLDSIRSPPITADLFINGQQQTGTTLTGLCAPPNPLFNVGNFSGSAPVGTEGFNHAIDELRISSSIRFVEP